MLATFKDGSKWLMEFVDLGLIAEDRYVAYVGSSTRRPRIDHLIVVEKAVVDLRGARGRDEEERAGLAEIGIVDFDILPPDPDEDTGA
jgi:hypothetical protein